MGLLRKGENSYSIPMEDEHRKEEGMPENYPREILHKTEGKETYPILMYKNTDTLKAWLIRGKRGWRKDHMVILLNITFSNAVKEVYEIDQAGNKRELLCEWNGFLWSDQISAGFMSKDEETQWMAKQRNLLLESIVELLAKGAAYTAGDVFSVTSSHREIFLFVQDKGLLLKRWARKGQEVFNVSVFQHSVFIDLDKYPDFKMGEGSFKDIFSAMEYAKKLVHTYGSVDAIHNKIVYAKQG